MAQSRPSVVSKRTEIRNNKHIFSAPEIQAPKRTLDKLLVSVGYLGVFSYLAANAKKFSPMELATISITAFTVGYGMWDLGRRNGRMEGAALALKDPPFSHLERTPADSDEGVWEREDYDKLSPEEKIAWLQREADRIKELQRQEEATCGHAYIAKEDAYKKYERIGAYGGQDWKDYSEADKLCQDMYNRHMRRDKRLKQIKSEVRELSEEL